MVGKFDSGYRAAILLYQRQPEIMSTHNETRCSFVADPAVVYFPISSPGYALRQSVKVVNSGKLSARMHVFPCKRPVFSVLMDSKKGFIAPGMHQTMDITCIPECLDVLEEEVMVYGEVRRTKNGWYAQQPDDIA